MLVDLGTKPRNENNVTTPVYTYRVQANIYSEKKNDYVAEWIGGTFTNFSEAFEFWDNWQVPSDEVDEIMKKERENGDYSHHELEVAIWCDDIDDLPFMNMTLDCEHEQA